MLHLLEQQNSVKTGASKLSFKYLPYRLVNRRMCLLLAAARKYALIICMRLLVVISISLLTVL